MKQCRRCRVEKALDAFPAARRNRDGADSWCKECRRAYSREQRAADPGRRKAHDHRAKMAKYGLTPEAYAAMLKAQGGACAICGARCSGLKPGERLHVDHDHGNGRVRALLCGRCNTAIGLMRDSSELLAKAAAYLEDQPITINGGAFHAADPVR